MEEASEIMRAVIGDLPTEQEVRLFGILRCVFQVDYLSNESRLDSIKKDLNKIELLNLQIRSLCENIDSKLLEKTNNSTFAIDSLVVRASLGSLASDLRKSTELGFSAIKKYQANRRNTKEFSTEVFKRLKSNDNKDLKVLTKRNKNAILNKVLYEMYVELKTYPKIVSFFKKFPEIKSEDLGRSFDEASIRQRVERHRIKSKLK